MRFINYSPAIAFIIFTLNLGLAWGQDKSGEDQYQTALALNKAKQYQKSADILKGLMSQHPEIERYRSDYIAVASNAQRCNQIRSYNNSQYLKSAPIYVQDAVFTCALQTESFEKIQLIAKTILATQGKNFAIESRMIEVAQKNQNLPAAIDWSKRLLQDYPNNLNAWEIRIKLLQSQGDSFSVLLLQEDALRLRPKDRHIQEQILQTLISMGAPNLALQLIENNHWPATPQQKLTAMRNSAAMYLRWSDADLPVAPNRFNSVDKGIELLTQSEQYANSISASTDQIHAIQFDFIVAYTKRKSWSKALAVYQKLEEQKIHVPDYALKYVAISYSGNHQYREAEHLLQMLCSKNPSDPNLQLALYYSLVDQDKFSEAKVVLEKLTAELKNRPTYLPKPEFNYTDAMIQKASFESYQEKYKEANEHIDELLKVIPSNADLLKTAGNVYALQGMPETAANYYQIAINQDPQDIEAQAGYANARMDQGDIGTFLTTVQSLQAGYSDMTDVQKATQRMEQFQEGYVTGNFVLGNGDYGTQKNNNRTSDLRVYSSPLDENYRGFVRYRDLNSGPAIPVTTQGVGAGVQYTGIHQQAELEAGDQGYFRAEGTRSLSDQWDISASYERNAFYLLPGALYATYAGNVAGMNLKWKNGDSTSASLGYRYWVLPSNTKQEIYGFANQRLWTEYNYKIDLSGWIGNQQNTNSNVSYFAPINQTEYSGTLNFRVLQWRDIATKKYDFWHRFFGSYGLVTQAGYSTLTMNNYGYGQDFNVGDRKTLSWGVGKTSFPFNGVRSSYITGYLNFEARY